MSGAVRCGNSVCESGAEARQAAIKRLSEMSFSSTARRKKYVESCTMLYRAAAQLDTCTITASTPNTTPRNTFLPRFADNNQHCHCPLAADCYVRAAAVYITKLKQVDMQYQSLILAAQLLITCKRTPDAVSGYERLMEADGQRQAAGLTDRELHTQLATLLSTVSAQLWSTHYYQRSIRALEISLSCYTRAIASHWNSDLSDQLHSIRVSLADRHVEYAIMLQTKAVSPAQGDTVPPKAKQQDHFQRGKELYEQAARYFPGRYLLRREISTAFGLHKNDSICELIAGYSVERVWIVLCLFRASLSDLIICNRDNTMPPRVIDKPRILNKYCAASRSFVQSPECKLIRAVGGLLHLSTILPVPMSYVEKDKRILQAWMNELLRELHNVINTYNTQTTLSAISKKMLGFIEIQIANNVAEYDPSLDCKQNGS